MLLRACLYSEVALLKIGFRIEGCPRSREHDHPAVDEIETLRAGPGKAHVLFRDQTSRSVSGSERVDLPRQILDDHGCEALRRLVQQQAIGTRIDGAGNCQELLLATTEFEAAPFLQVAQQWEKSEISSSE